MDNQSPPKRVTRARAAAKTSENVTDIQTTKIATAASKAKVTRSISTTITMRKTRGGDAQVESEELSEQLLEQQQSKTTRGRRPRAVESGPEIQVEMDAPPTRRPRKVAVQSNVEEAPAKTIRGRPKKAPEGALATEPAARSLRGRKKVDVAEDLVDVLDDLPKRPTRGRTVPAMKVAPKKSVKFEETDKENFVPLLATVKGKAKAAEMVTGLKAKPVRKAATTRATRARPKAEEPKSSPLSPKKATQMPLVKDNSEDELAVTEKTPMKPLMKSSPIKAPGSIFGSTKQVDFSTTIMVNRVSTNDMGVSKLGSPARRPPQSSFKEGLKISPQRAGFGNSMLRSPFKFSLPGVTAPDISSPAKPSLLQSPARRPQVTEAGSPTRSTLTFAVTPKASTFKISRFNTPRTLTKSIRTEQTLPPPPAVEKAVDADAKQDVPKLSFSGRLSSIMPRDTDLALSASEPISEESEDLLTDIIQPIIITGTTLVDSNSSTPPCSTSQTSTRGAFALREIDENSFMDSDSEDELASGSPRYSPIPLSAFKTASRDFATLPTTPFRTTIKTLRTNQPAKLGFTPLAKQLNDWMATSPEKSGSSCSSSEAALPPPNEVAAVSPDLQPSPAKSTYFDDEMTVREGMETVEESFEEFEEEPILEAINFAPVEVDEEDVALAAEAEEMSLLESEEIACLEQRVEESSDIEEQNLGHSVIADSLNIEKQFETVEQEFGIVHRSGLMMSEPVTAEPEFGDLLLTEPAVSEASQEYGDENAIPIDPILLALPVPSTPKFATPKRVLAERVFHTISKVPLKPAADDTPMRPSPMKRSASSSKLPVQRPSNSLTRSNTVISYSPTKNHTPRANMEQEDSVMQGAYETPAKADTDPWSTAANLARTPRRDLNIALLKGAVVFVDVHTTEGADASLLFTELLNQMGARCVKRWDWNGEEGSKIGITHVVFKDGGKRTLQKVKETGGVVTCVGVGWVLDCERENKWLPESPYSIDSNMVPRGGHRRRKSMEPRALAKLSAMTLAPATPGPTRPARKTMSPSKEAFVVPGTPFTSKSNRRDSVQWVRSPASSNGNLDDQSLILSPVPATPTPENISAYAEDGIYGDLTPSAHTPYFLHKEQLVQKTAPPGKRYFDDESGSAFLSEKKDESVMMRLMAVRRKSLQWAPKVGSPLARSEEW